MSSSRETILAAARANKPAETPLPTVPDFGGDDSTERFTQVLTSIGGQVVWIDGPEQLRPVLEQLYPESRLSASPLFPATLPVDALTSTEVLADVDLAVLPGEMGVAENGCIWLPEANMLHRALPPAHCGHHAPSLRAVAFYRWLRGLHSGSVQDCGYRAVLGDWRAWRTQFGGVAVLEKHH
jgi:hypothetical protein